MIRKILFLLPALFLLAVPARADSQGAVTPGTVGTQSTLIGCYYTSATPAPASGQQLAVHCDSSGNLLTSGGGGGAVTTTPGQRTIVALDISTVTTGGTAVTALNSGHRTAGGFLQNPIGATIALCISEQGTASGTTSSGATTCIQPGQSYGLTPAAAAVSVITSDSSHPFSGFGLN